MTADSLGTGLGRTRRVRGREPGSSVEDRKPPPPAAATPPSRSVRAPPGGGAPCGWAGPGGAAASGTGGRGVAAAGGRSVSQSGRRTGGRHWGRRGAGSPPARFLSGGSVALPVQLSRRRSAWGGGAERAALRGAGGHGQRRRGRAMLLTFLPALPFLLLFYPLKLLFSAAASTAGNFPEGWASSGLAPRGALQGAGHAARWGEASFGGRAAPARDAPSDESGRDSPRAPYGYAGCPLRPGVLRAALGRPGLGAPRELLGLGAAGRRRDRTAAGSCRHGWALPCAAGVPPKAAGGGAALPARCLAPGPGSLRGASEEALCRHVGVREGWLGTDCCWCWQVRGAAGALPENRSASLNNIGCSFVFSKRLLFSFGYAAWSRVCLAFKTQ